jgi:hypothetical protein
VEVLDAHFAQADFTFVEARHHLDVGAGAQLARQLVRPGVIGADHHLAVALAGHQLVRAVLADIVEGANDAIAAAMQNRFWPASSKVK